LKYLLDTEKCIKATVLSILGNFKRARQKVKELIFSQMALTIKETLKIIKLMTNMESSKVSTLNIEAALRKILFMVRALKKQKTITLKVHTIMVKK
jgi:hypothetical protein